MKVRRIRNNPGMGTSTVQAGRLRLMAWLMDPRERRRRAVDPSELRRGPTHLRGGSRWRGRLDLRGGHPDLALSDDAAPRSTWVTSRCATSAAIRPAPACGQRQRDLARQGAQPVLVARRRPVRPPGLRPPRPGSVRAHGPQPASDDGGLRRRRARLADTVGWHTRPWACPAAWSPSTWLSAAPTSRPAGARARRAAAGRYDGIALSTTPRAWPTGSRGPAPGLRGRARLLVPGPGRMAEDHGLPRRQSDGLRTLPARVLTHQGGRLISRKESPTNGPSGGSTLDGISLRPLVSNPDTRGEFIEVFSDRWDTGIEPAQWSIVHAARRPARDAPPPAARGVLHRGLGPGKRGPLRPPAGLAD